MLENGKLNYLPLAGGRRSYKYGNTINYFALNGIREF
jgi:hypothetical protein